MRIAPSLVLIVAVTAAVGACHPRNHAEQSTQSESNQSGHAEERHGGHELKRVCADDIAKYCQSEDHKKRCLKQNLDKLGAECKAAVEAARGHKHEKDSSDND